MPHSCHKALAITGAIAIASSCAINGTVTRQVTAGAHYGNITIEHPGGALDIYLTNEGMSLKLSELRLFAPPEKYSPVMFIFPDSIGHMSM
jgi:2-methylaconitate cis-trans-isomerase PrpF